MCGICVCVYVCCAYFGISTSANRNGSRAITIYLPARKLQRDRRNNILYHSRARPPSARGPLIRTAVISSFITRRSRKTGGHFETRYPGQEGRGEGGGGGDGSAAARAVAPGSGTRNRLTPFREVARCAGTIYIYTHTPIPYQSVFVILRCINDSYHPGGVRAGGAEPGSDMRTRVFAVPSPPPPPLLLQSA